MIAFNTSTTGVSKVSMSLRAQGAERRRDNADTNFGLTMDNQPSTHHDGGDQASYARGFLQSFKKHTYLSKVKDYTMIDTSIAVLITYTPVKFTACAK